MDYEYRLGRFFFELKDTLMEPSTWVQIFSILLSLTIALLLQRFWAKNLPDPEAGKSRLRQFTLATGQRLLFPFSALLLVLAIRAIFLNLEYPAVLLDIAVPLLLSLGIVRLTVYLLRKAFPPTPVLKAWENSLATIIWIGVALHLLGWLPDILKALESVAINVGDSHISILWILKLVTSVAFFLLVAMWTSAVIEKKLFRSEHLSAGLKVGLAKTGRVLLITVGFFIALNTIGIDLTALTVFSGALGVGLGFGLQRIASNFISGFILLFDRSIRPGDVVSIGESFGLVRELRARYIVVRDRDGVERLIPNENLITSEVINWSYSDRNIRLKIPVQISYDDEPKQAMALLLDAAKASNRVLKEPVPVARLISFGDNGIDLELRVWLSDPQEGLGSVRSDINLAIWKLFKENNITIPFPQRDVHLINQNGQGNINPEQA